MSCIKDQLEYLVSFSLFVIFYIGSCNSDFFKKIQAFSNFINPQSSFKYINFYDIISLKSKLLHRVFSNLKVLSNFINPSSYFKSNKFFWYKATKIQIIKSLL